MNTQINGIHLDFKYLCLRKSYLPCFFDEVGKYGINTILLEMEDCFPYRCVPAARSPEAFSPEEFRALLDQARSRGLNVIPLVQTLSHLEFILAHPEYASFRELEQVHTMICPTGKNGGRELVLQLIDEMLEYFPDEKFFHIGGDEAWHLGDCPECKAAVEKGDKIALWLEHELKIMNHLISKGKRPIVWDDIFWKEPERVSALPKEVVLMSWNYGVSASGKVDDKGHTEYGLPDSKLTKPDVYKKAGFDVIGCPCCNYGQSLLPRHHDSIGNMRAWALKNRDAKMRGMLTSSWAVFHVPMQTQLPLIAASAALVKDPDLPLDKTYFAAWAKEFFGAEVPEFDTALEYAGQLWEIPMPELKRPFSPLPYSYMNIVLGYPGGQEERERRGVYPLDWNELDFAQMYRRGVSTVMQSDTAKIRADYDRLSQELPLAERIFAELAQKAVKNRDIAQMFFVFTRLKRISLKVFGMLAGFEHVSAAAVISEELNAVKEDFRTSLRLCYEESGVQRLMQVCFDPLYNVLKQER